MLILLSGPLGSGKTNFVKHLGKALGIKDLIKSPTFSYLHRYKIRHGQYQFLYHFDLYRLEKGSFLAELEEAIHHDSILTVIEWPEKIPSLQYYPHLKCSFRKKLERYEIQVYTGEDFNEQSDSRIKKK